MAKSNTEMNSTFTCMICFEFPKEPINCRYCTNFVCKSCIDDWFRHNINQEVGTCPTCRKITKRDDFIRLAWLEDHLKSINENTTINECSQHIKQELCIYCSTCSKSICAQCILPMFNGEHSDHNYARLDTAKQRLLKAIDEQENNIESDLNQLDTCIQNKKLIIDQILIQRKERLNELEQFQTNIKTQIEFEATKELKKFHNEQKNLIQEKTTYEKKYTILKKTIESCNQIELFEKEKEFFQQISQRSNLLILDKINLSDNIVQSPLLVPWKTGKFEIKQFSTKPKNNDRISTAQIQLVHNQSWTLFIYPNGKGPDTGVYLSIMLQLNKGITQSIDYNIIIELINHQYDDDKHNYIFKTLQSFKEGESYSFDQFYQLNNLSNNGFLNLETDSIKFRLKLSPKSIFDERKLLLWRIESLKKNERNTDEQHREMNKTKDELTRLTQDYKETNQILEDQRIKINELEKQNSELKRKRTESYDDYQSGSDPSGTIIFGNEKRLKK